MVAILSVLWTVVPEVTPEPCMNCRRCGMARPFRSSRKFRVNAHGKQVDAWLIYKCTACDNTWNRPVLERQHVDSVDPSFLEALHRNDEKLAGRLARDVGGLPRGTATAGSSAQASLHKVVLSAAATTPRWLELRLAVPQSVALRLDRLLSRELGLSRKRIQTLQKGDHLVILPEGPRLLRRPLRDGTCVTLDLSRESDAERICAAGVS